MKRVLVGCALFATCLLAATAAAADLPSSVTSFAIARQGERPVEQARQIVVGGGFYYGGVPVYAYRPYYYSYRPYYNYAYSPYYYGYTYSGYRPYVYAPYTYTYAAPYAYNYYRPYVYNYRPYVYGYRPYVTRYYGGYYRGRPYYRF